MPMAKLQQKSHTQPNCLSHTDIMAASKSLDWIYSNTPGLNAARRVYVDTQIHECAHTHTNMQDRQSRSRVVRADNRDDR